MFSVSCRPLGVEWLQFWHKKNEYLPMFCHCKDFILLVHHPRMRPRCLTSRELQRNITAMTSQSWCLQLCPCPQKSACKMCSGPILQALFNDLNSVTVCARDEIQMVQERRHYGDIWCFTGAQSIHKVLVSEQRQKNSFILPCAPNITITPQPF